MDKEKIAKWMAEGETGMSSKSMAQVALGYKGHVISWPHDPSDFRRCYLFLMAVSDEPEEHKKLLDKLAKNSPKWAIIRDNWEELLGLYLKEYRQKTAPRLYKKMKDLKL